MADFRLTTVLTTLVLLHGFLDHVCWSCTILGKWRPPILVNQILEYGNILYGVVRETYPEGDYSSAYTVELEVYCILKGATTPSVINITRGGYIPGWCYTYTFHVGHEYVVLAYNLGKLRHPPELIVNGSPIDATQENLEEVTKACGLNPVTRPKGSSSRIKCPVSVSDCQSERTPYDVPTEEGDYGDAWEMDMPLDE